MSDRVNLIESSINRPTMKNLINRAIRRLQRWGQPSPRLIAAIEADWAAMDDSIVVDLGEPLTVEEVIRRLRADGLSYRAIMAKTGCSYHKVRQTCLSA